MVASGWPVLVSLSNKDFVGETLGGLPVGERLTGTLATTAVCAWLGAVVFRVHNVVETRQALDLVAAIKADRPPARALRGPRLNEADQRRGRTQVPGVTPSSRSRYFRIRPTWFLGSSARNSM